MLLKREKDIDNNVHAFEKQINTLISLNIEDEKLKLTFYKIIDKIEVFEGGKLRMHYSFKDPNNISGA